MQTLRLDLQIEGFTDTVSIEAFAPMSMAYKLVIMAGLSEIIYIPEFD